MIHIYERVSTVDQNLDGQHLALMEWVGDRPHKVWKDRFTGKAMKRPQFDLMLSELKEGDTVAVYRLDRLGRNSAGLTALFEKFKKDGIILISLKEGLDLATPAGRLIADILASVAEFETEARRERVQSAIYSARMANGGPTAPTGWGGSKKGRATKFSLPDSKRDLVVKLANDGIKKAQIARDLGVSRSSVYAILKEAS